MKTSKHRDHPRICGEKGDLIPIYLDEVGSPPHMRGKVFKNFHHDSDSGITPAYAGKSLLCQLQVLVCKDHPRLCGEKYVNKRSLIIGDRITPAYAGKSPYSVAA